MGQKESDPLRILTEDVITVKQVQKQLQQVTKKRHDKSVIGRWMDHGVGGVKLEFVRIGRLRYTSTQAVTRFIRALSE